MPIKTSGQISYGDDIVVEFDDFDPNTGLAEYYGASVDLPIFGNPLAFSDFYGAIDLKLQIAFAQSDDTELVAEYAGVEEIIYQPEAVTVGTASLFGFSLTGGTDSQQESQGYRIVQDTAGNTYYAVGSGDGGVVSTQTVSTQYITETLTRANAGYHGFTELSQTNMDGYTMWIGGGYEDPVVLAAIGGYSTAPLKSWKVTPPGTVTDYVTTSNYSQFGYSQSSGSGWYYFPNSSYTKYTKSSSPDLYLVSTDNSGYLYQISKASTANSGEKVWLGNDDLRSIYGFTANGSVNNFPAYIEDGDSSKNYFLGPNGDWTFLSEITTPGTESFDETLRYNNGGYFYDQYIWTNNSVLSGYLKDEWPDTVKLAAYGYYLKNDSTNRIRLALQELALYTYQGYYYCCHKDDEEFKQMVARWAGGSEVGFLLLETDNRTFCKSPDAFYEDPYGGGATPPYTKNRIRFKYYTTQNSLGNIFLFSQLQYLRDNGDKTNLAWTEAKLCVNTSAASSSSYYARFNSADWMIDPHSAVSVTYSSTDPVYSNIKRTLTFTPYESSYSTPQVVEYFSESRSRNKNFYSYSAVERTRDPVPAVPGTPAFSYDNARESKYRVSTSTANAYETEDSWPKQDAFGVGWRPQSSSNAIIQYFCENMIIQNGVITPRNLEFFNVVSSTTIGDFHSENIPARLDFGIYTDENGVVYGNPQELGYTKFFKLKRSQNNGSIELGYISPQVTASKPTFTAVINGDNSELTLGNLDAGVTYRLLWSSYQDSVLSFNGNTAVASAEQTFLGNAIPTLVLSGGDNVSDPNLKQGVDLFLQARVSQSPEVYATVRCFEYFRNGSQKLVEAACDYLDGIGGE